MEENHSDAPMEGYLQKRFHAGIVKSLKKKWYVLKDGELRCYQNEDACKKNAEMYQDAVPVNHIQTVRIASEKHGVEVVTQQKKFILVASSDEDQKKWIKAIYEALKDNRPRSVSCPAEKPSPTRKISASKFASMFTFNRKSLDETQNDTQSQFYVKNGTATEQSHSQFEIGVQADVQADVQVDIQGDVKADVQGDVQTPQSNTPVEVSQECQNTTAMKTENTDNNRHSMTEGSHLMDESQQGDSSCVERKPKETTDDSIVLNGQDESQDTPPPKPCPDEQAGLNEALMKQHEVTCENGDITRQEMTEEGKESEQCFEPKVPSDSLDTSGQNQVDTLIQTTESLPLNEPLHEKETLDGEDEEKAVDAKAEKSIHELQALLKSISEEKFSDCDEVFSSDNESIPIGSDDESETTQKGKSAFEQLQELLNG